MNNLNSQNHLSQTPPNSYLVRLRHRLRHLTRSSPSVSSTSLSLRLRRYNTW